MKSQRERQKIARQKRRQRSQVVRLVFFCAIMILGYSGWQMVQLDTTVEAKRQALLEKKGELTKANDALRQEIERLNTPSYIEQLAREKLGLVRKGEILLAPKEDEE